MKSSFDQRQLFETLKKVLKAKKISYRELSKQVSFSEATLKIIFHNNNTSIERIVEICDVIGVSFPDLVQLAAQDNNVDFSFTHEQEQFFVDHPNFYNFFRLIFFEKKSPEDIQREYKLTEASTFKYLRGLEKIDILEIHPKNKLKFKYYGRLKWTHDGPWMKKYFSIYSDQITHLLLKNLHNQEYLSTFGFFTVPQETVDEFKKEILQVEKKYKDLAFRASLMEKHDKFIPVTWLFDIIPTDIVSHNSSIPNL